MCVMSLSLLDASVVAGPLPMAIEAVGAVACVGLMVGRSRVWWLRSVPLAVVIGVVFAAAVGLAVAVFRPFPDLLPTRVLVWIAVMVIAVGLAWGRRHDGWVSIAVAVVAVLAVLGTCAMKVNAFYGYRPTIGAALGIPAANQVDLAQLPSQPQVWTARPRQALARSWHAPAGMPEAGRIATVTIPGGRSRFPARPAWLYLPPAYLGSLRARLPVLVLIPGQPGGPQDWILAGRLAAVMDEFAAAHDGLAPLVVVPDVTGSSLGNTLCLDSRLGAAETYLADDVPAWVATHLQADTDHFAIGGFSFGGTCALQLALRRPDVYRTFLDVSGQVQPTLGDLHATVAAAFGGDAAAFQRVDPLVELHTRTYPATAGVLVVGRDDEVYRPQAEQVAAAAEAAHVTVTLVEVPGEHSWAIATAALAAALPWLAGRAGILDPTPAPTPDVVTVAPAGPGEGHAPVTAAGIPARPGRVG
jgi:S-formylglutathione hydrolase FrmB